MPRFDITSEVAIKSDARVKQVEGIFDIPPSERSVTTFPVNLPIEEREWQIGLIVGPSGCGKTSIARHAFSDKVISGYEWDPAKAIVSQFPKALSIADVTGFLSSVGFSSPPSWLRPFWALSNGEQFRVTLARALAEEQDLFVIDEFTSVVDRTVAQIGSCAVSKAIRRTKKQMIALSCHFDVIEWLQPDWIYEPAGNLFQWRSLRRRPDIDLTVRRVDKAAWNIFKKHHYMSSEIHAASQCWVGFIGETPACFLSMLHRPHPVRPMWSGSRLVVMPDFQGIGLGMKMFDTIAAMYRAKGKGVTGTSANPAMISYIARSPKWLITRKPSRFSSTSSPGNTGAIGDTKRKTASFEFRGAVDAEGAKAFGIV